MADATGTSAQVRLVGRGARRAVAPGRRGRVLGQSGTVITFPGFLRAYVEGSRTTPRPSWPTARSQLPALAEGDTLSAQRPRARLAHHPAAGPLHRGVAGEGPGGARRRPALDLRQHHRHHPGPGLRVEEGHGARAVASPPSPWSACSSATSATWSTTASPPPWRTTSTRSPRARGGAALADALLLRRRTAPTRAGTARSDRSSRRASRTTVAVAPGRDRRPRGQLHPHRRPTPTARPIVARVGRYGPYLQRGEDRASIPEDLAARRADRRAGRGAPGRPVGRPGARRPTPRAGSPVLVRPGRFGPYVQLGEAVDGGDKPRTASLFKPRWRPTTRHARAGAASCCACPGSVGHRPRRRARRSWPTTAASVPILKKGTDTRSLDDRGAAAHRDPRRGPGAVRPAQDAPGPGARRRRCASSATTPTTNAAHRGADGPLRALRDRRHDQRLAAQGRRRSRRSPSSGPPSCWPTAGPRARR